MLTPVFRISTLCWGTALKRNFNALPSHRHALLLPLPLVAPSLIQAPTTNERPLKLVTMGVLCTAAARAARRRIWSTPPSLTLTYKQTTMHHPPPRPTQSYHGSMCTVHSPPVRLGACSATLELGCTDAFSVEKKKQNTTVGWT